MNSTSDDDDDEDETYPIYTEYDEHMQYMAARERLEEFSGRIPPRKKKNSAINTNSQQRKSRVSTRSRFHYYIVAVCTFFLLFSMKATNIIVSLLYKFPVMEKIKKRCLVVSDRQPTNYCFICH